MSIIAASALLGALMLSLFRSLVLSAHADKFTDALIWRLDFGSRYGWMFAGIALIAVHVHRLGFSGDTLIYIGLWLIGLAMIWLLPAALLRLF